MSNTTVNPAPHTERQIAEQARTLSAAEALRNSRQSVHDIPDNPAAFVGLFTPDGIILETNQPPLELAGLQRDDVMGKQFAETYWWNYAPEVQAQIRDTFCRAAKGEIVSGDFRPRMAHGVIIDIIAVFAPLYDASGMVVKVIGAGFDISGRKQTETALRESHKTFQQLADNITDAFWIRSPDMREIRYLSPAFERIWGRSVQSLSTNPHHWVDFIVPEDRDHVRGVFATLTGEARSIDIEYRIARPDGEIRWIRARGFQVRDAAGELVSLTGIVNDITERQRAAEALRTSLEEISRTNQVLQSVIVERKRAEHAAETANRSKGEFLANMSHEIRTPLNGVLGMTELVLGTNLSAEQREYLDMVKSSGESLLMVINDILDFSKIDAGMLTVDAIPFDLRSCLVAALKLLAMRAHAKGLELTCDIRPDVPAAVVGDPSRLRQIITNLIGNAIKFTEHGRVSLAVEAETQTGENATVRFSVSDTGIGIPQEQQEAIFKPFVQADGSTTRKYGGTGLGLAISTNLVALLGGRIGLNSEAGKGSTFHFTIPFGLQVSGPSASPDGVAVVARHFLREGGGNLRILLVEDVKINQLVAARMLEKRGHTVVVAANGREALAAMDEPASGEFDLVLMDVQMPDMDGFEATRVIRAKEKSSGTHMPIIAMTAHAMKGDKERCLDAGMDGYLSKPFQAEKVFATIDSVLFTRDLHHRDLNHPATGPQSSFVPSSNHAPPLALLDQD